MLCWHSEVDDGASADDKMMTYSGGDEVVADAESIET